MKKNKVTKPEQIKKPVEAKPTPKKVKVVKIEAEPKPVPQEIEIDIKVMPDKTIEIIEKVEVKPKPAKGPVTRPPGYVFGPHSAKTK